MRKNLFFIIYSLFFAMPAALHAWPLVTDETIRGAWGAPGGTWEKYPRGSNYASFCVGNTKSSSGGCQAILGIHGDDYAMVGLVARKITPNGGYFCVQQFQCEGKRDSWTWNLAPNGVQQCFWLCENGYSGNGCSAINVSEYNIPATSSACPQTNISRDGFNSNNVRTSGNTGLNQENSIELLHSTYISGMEQDVMVGVSEWLDNKKGVVASPFLFHCTNRANGNTMDLNFYINYAAKKLCLPGYTGENCELCKPANPCSGYDTQQFVATAHTMSQRGNCSVFTCTDTTKGFQSATERGTCVECGTTGRDGVDSDGVCVKCAVGQLFNETVQSTCKGTACCKTATTFNSTEMQYGKAQNSAPSDVLDACWTLTDPNQYAACVETTKNASTARQQACTKNGGKWNGSAKTCN